MYHAATFSLHSLRIVFVIQLLSYPIVRSERGVTFRQCGPRYLLFFHFSVFMGMI